MQFTLTKHHRHYHSNDDNDQRNYRHHYTTTTTNHTTTILVFLLIHVTYIKRHRYVDLGSHICLISSIRSTLQHLQHKYSLKDKLAQK